ncbi:hypothetical protein JANLI_12990 [Janthinobacterium lividum]|nr:hypothetical protein JANLI_12990 [Janthinobacterium lividum]
MPRRIDDHVPAPASPWPAPLPDRPPAPTVPGRAGRVRRGAGRRRRRHPRGHLARCLPRRPAAAGGAGPVCPAFSRRPSQGAGVDLVQAVLQRPARARAGGIGRLRLVLPPRPRARAFPGRRRWRAVALPAGRRRRGTAWPGQRRAPAAAGARPHGAGGRRAGQAMPLGAAPALEQCRRDRRRNAAAMPVADGIAAAHRRRPGLPVRHGAVAGPAGQPHAPAHAPGRKCAPAPAMLPALPAAARFLRRLQLRAVEEGIERGARGQGARQRRRRGMVEHQARREL